MACSRVNSIQIFNICVIITLCFKLINFTFQISPLFDSEKYLLAAHITLLILLALIWRESCDYYS